MTAIPQLQAHQMGEIRRGLSDAAPVLMAVAPYALVLGAQSSQLGLSVAEVGTMTSFNFAGGSEFAAIQLWSATPPALMIILITFLINSRHIVMGAALTPFVRGGSRARTLIALFFMADEGWALSYADARRRDDLQISPAFSWPYYWGATVPFYPIWVGFAVLGALIGPSLSGIADYGLAMAFPAVFLVLMRGMWQGVRFARPWLVSLVAAGLAYHLTPDGWFVLIGTLCGAASAYFLADDA